MYSVTELDRVHWKYLTYYEPCSVRHVLTVTRHIMHVSLSLLIRRRFETNLGLVFKIISTGYDVESGGDMSQACFVFFHPLAFFPTEAPVWYCISTRVTRPVCVRVLTAMLFIKYWHAMNEAPLQKRIFPTLHPTATVNSTIIVINKFWNKLSKSLYDFICPVIYQQKAFVRYRKIWKVPWSVDNHVESHT